MGAWVIGHNLAGYLPESDTYAVETREDAVSAFVSEAEYYASTDDDSATDAIMAEYDSEGDVPEDEWPTMRATVDAILTDDGPDSPDLAGKDYGMHVEDSRGRLIYFWMQWAEDHDPDTDDTGTPLD